MKRLIPLFCFIIIAFNSYSQRWYSGFSGGITASQVDGDPYKGYFKAGIYGGAYLQYKIYQDLGLQAELTYIMKGSSDGNQIEGTNTYYRMLLHYFEFPFSVQYYYNKRVTIEGGPTLGYLVTSSEKDENGIMFDTLPFKKLEFSGHAGIHYQAFEKLGLRARFSYSIFIIRDHAGGAVWYLNNGQRNNLFSFGVTYLL